MSDELARMAEVVRERLLRVTEAGEFDPVQDWYDLGTLIRAMEIRGCFLMLNSTSHGGLRRIAAFHVDSGPGFPCVGSSEWGAWSTVGEAVLRAAYEALVEPRVEFSWSADR